MRIWILAGVNHSQKLVDIQIIANESIAIWCEYLLNDIDFISEIHVRLPENVTSKNLKVNIAYASIEIHAIINGDRTKLLAGQLSEKCKAPDAMWTITGGNRLNISVGK